LTSVALSCDGRQNVAGLAWSADEARLAVSDCVAASSTQYRTRILEPATGATVAVVSGGTYGIRSLLTGDLIVSSEPTQGGEGARPRWVIYSFSGVEKARLVGYAPTVSPDGRYVLDSTCCAGEGFTLAPLGTEPDRATMGSAIWLPDGRVLVLTR